MSGERGFTILEVLIAVMILTVGLLGLVSTAALVTRMIAQGAWYSEASTRATRQFENFRSRWTGTGCAGAANGSSASDGFTLTWTVTSAAGGRARQVQLVVQSPTARGPRTDTFYSTILC